MIEVITSTKVRVGSKEARIGIRLAALTVLAVTAITITALRTRKI